MGSEKVVILAMLVLVIGIYLELKGTGALIEALVVAFVFIISESRLTGELIRSEIKSVCDKMNNKELRRNNSLVSPESEGCDEGKL